MTGWAILVLGELLAALAVAWWSLWIPPAAYLLAAWLAPGWAPTWLGALAALVVGIAITAVRVVREPSS